MHDSTLITKFLVNLPVSKQSDTRICYYSSKHKYHSNLLPSHHGKRAVYISLDFIGQQTERESRKCIKVIGLFISLGIFLSIKALVSYEDPNAAGIKTRHLSALLPLPQAFSLTYLILKH